MAVTHGSPEGKRGAELPSSSLLRRPANNRVADVRAQHAMFDAPKALLNSDRNCRSRCASARRLDVSESVRTVSLVREVFRDCGRCRSIHRLS